MYILRKRGLAVQKHPPQKHIRLLVIESEEELAVQICAYLEPLGYYTLDRASDGLEGWEKAVSNEYDALLIAVILPGMDGLTICRRLREMGSRIPIVMMTRSESVEKRVLCLNLGADDFLIRYFEMMEMEARIRAVVRRSRQQNTPLILRWGGLELNPCTHTVLCDGTPLHLRPICFTMLACLMRSAPGIVTREELTREVYGDSPPDSDSLRTHIHLLRRALEKQGKPILQTVTHVGFRLEG